VDAENAARQRAAGDRPIPMLGTPVTFVELGLARLYAGQPEPALVAFERARTLAPSDAEAAQNAAIAALTLGRNDDALGNALEALLLDPRRAGLGDLLLASYGRVDPGGCGIVGAPGQVQV